MRKREKTKGDPEFLGWAMEGMALSCTEMGEAAGAKVGDNTVRSSVLDMSAFEVPVRPPSRDIQVGTFLKKIPIPPHLNQRKNLFLQLMPLCSRVPPKGSLHPFAACHLVLFVWMSPLVASKIPARSA